MLRSHRCGTSFSRLELGRLEVGSSDAHMYACGRGYVPKFYSEIPDRRFSFPPSWFHAYVSGIP
jgi:hypothetical protein